MNAPASAGGSPTGGGEAGRGADPRAAARRRAVVTRAFLVHLMAYGVAIPWAIAAIPAIFAWKEGELLAMPSEREAVLRVVTLAAYPTLVAGLLGHLPGIPWVLAARREARGGRGLFIAGTAVLALLGVVAAAIGWVRIAML